MTTWSSISITLLLLSTFDTSLKIDHFFLIDLLEIVYLKETFCVKQIDFKQGYQRNMFLPINYL